METRDPHTLVVVRFLQRAIPFGPGDQVELTWRDAEGLVRQGIAALVQTPSGSEVETR